ncbi:MAG: hypothetical protein ACE5GD_02575 [Candidatus Geothermarchaeales archaeon]
MSVSEIYVRIDWEGNTLEFRGDPEKVVREVESFLMKTIPQISLARKIQISIDAQDLTDIISPLVRVTPTGEVVLLVAHDKASLSERVLIFLMAQKFLFLTGMSREDHLSLQAIASKVIASQKSTSSRLSELYTRGFIEKKRIDGQIRYWVTVQGILDFKQRKLPKLLKKIA